MTPTPIALDYTLRDLYALDNEAKCQPVLVYYRLPFEPHESSLSVKFIYHSSMQAEDITWGAWAALDSKAVPQRYGFTAGQMSLVMPDVDSPGHKQSPGAVPSGYVDAHRHDIHSNFARLRHDQQPNVRFATNPDHITLEPGTLIAVAEPCDSMSHLPHLIDPEMHYEILSKRGLARSGLLTPPSTVIDPLLQPEDVHNPAQVQQEVARMTNFFDTYTIPFMVKLPQSFSGRGAFLVSSNADRTWVKALLSVQLRGMLMQINSANHHLYPCSLVLQDYTPGTEVALPLFVTPKGRPIFIACCYQRFDEDGYWTGGSISYADQAALEQLYTATMEQVAQFLHRKGYHGPVGVDIITDRSGRQYIVDLNARITGTYHLGPLAGHFMQRGVGIASVVTKYFSCSRAVFEEAFAYEIQQGCLIITGWSHDKSMGLSYGAVTVGGRDTSEIERELRKILAHAVAHAVSLHQ